MKKRTRVLLWIALALVLSLILAAVLTVWLARDWPRRQVQSALTRALDADVDLGRLEILDRRTFVLHDLGVRSVRDYPWLRTLRIDRTVVTGDLGEILQNRIESLVLDGVSVTVGESTVVPPERQETAGVEVGRLAFENGQLTVQGGDGESRLTLAGELTGLGQGLRGTVRLQSGQMPLLPLLCFAAGSDSVTRFADDSPLDLRHPVSGAEITVHFGHQGSAALLEARAAGGIPFRGSEREPLVFPDLQCRLDRSPEGGWHFSAGADSSGLAVLDVEGGMEADGSSPHLDRVDLETADPVLILSLLGLVTEDTAGRGRARLNIERINKALPRCRVSATAEQLTLPRGGPEGAAGGEPLLLDSLCPLELSYEGTLDEVGDSGDWLAVGRVLLTSAQAGELTVDGSLLLGGGSENSLDAVWSWSGPKIPALRRLAVVDFSIGWPKRYRMDGAPRVTGRASGTLDRPLVSGIVEVEGLSFCLESNGDPSCPLELLEGTLTAEFRFQEDRGLRFPGLSLRGDLRTGPLNPMPLSLSASARIDPSTLDGRFEELSVTVGDLARTTGEGRWVRQGDRLLTAAIQLEEADLPAIRRALVPFTGELLPGYELTAAVTGGFNAAYSAAGIWTIDGEIETGEVWFASDDGARVIQGLASEWQVVAEAGSDGSVRAEASTTASGFQLLWGSVFGDFQQLQPRIRFAVGLEGEGADHGRWWAEGDLQPVPGLQLQASLSGAGGQGRDFRTSLAVEDLATAFERCAQLPLGYSLPVLTRVSAGGRIDASARGHLAEDSATLRGLVRLDGLDFTGEERTMTVKGLDLDLPLDLVWGPPDAEGTRLVEESAARSGRMGFDELRLDTITFQRTDSALVVEGDTVSLEASQSIPLLGGTVTFHRLTLAGLLGAGRRLETGLAVEGLQLAELSRAQGWPQFEGELVGSLPRVVLSTTSLRVDGGGEISLFGGTVNISDISGEEVLSRYPRLSFSADFHEIDLARCTRTFDVGEVTGILEGRISNCQLFDGTPVGFQAEIRTVARKGVSQTINVKAINNIAIIGTGGRITIFDRGIHSLLDRYTYEQLGVVMRLENDRFYLRGTENRGDRELFLKGRLPFRIDVVNAEPGKTVSFSTMRSRLQSLDFSQAVTSAGGDENVKNP